MLPLECQYLNKNALTTLAGPLTPPVKHFQLKRKPKSATLRAELLQKCECWGLCPPGVGGALACPLRGRLPSWAWEVLQAWGAWLPASCAFCSMSVVFILRFPSGFMVPNYLLKTVLYIIFSVLLEIH